MRKAELNAKRAAIDNAIRKDPHLMPDAFVERFGVGRDYVLNRAKVLGIKLPLSYALTVKDRAKHKMSREERKKRMKNWGWTGVTKW